MKWIKRIAWVVLPLVVATSAFTLYLRADKADVFHETRGEYRKTEVLESERGAVSQVRLVAFYNKGEEAVARAYVRRPHALRDDYKIILTYGGNKTGKKILDLVPDRPDMVLVAIQYPLERPDSVLEYLRWPYDVRSGGFRAVAGGMLAVSFLEQTERLEIDRLTVLGASLGAIFATVHGALDERVPRTVLAHGGGNLPSVARAIERRKGRPVLGRLLGWIVAALAGSFDPVRYVDRIAPRELLMIAARDDQYFPPQSIQALYDRAGHPKQLIWTKTSHLSSRKTAAVEDLIARMDAYFENK